MQSEVLTDVYAIGLVVLLKSHLVLGIYLIWVLLVSSLVFQMMPNLQVHFYMNNLNVMM